MDEPPPVSSPSTKQSLNTQFLDYPHIHKTQILDILMSWQGFEIGPKR